MSEFLVIGVRPGGERCVLISKPTEAEAVKRQKLFETALDGYERIVVERQGRPGDELQGETVMAPETTNGAAATPDLGEWVGNLPPGIKFKEASARAVAEGVPLNQSAFYRFRPTGPSKPAPVTPGRKPAAKAPAPVAEATDSPVPAAVPLDVLPELARVVGRLGGIAATRAALDVIEALVNTLQSGVDS